MLKLNNNFYLSKGKKYNYNIENNNFCFILKNNYIYPIEKNYDIKINKIFNLDINNVIIIKLKIPKFIYNENYSFELDNFIKNIKGGINIKASNGNFNFLLSTDNKSIIVNDLLSTDNKSIIVNDYCGWINIDMKHIINSSICNICKISYSLFFEPFKAKVIKNKYSRNNIIIPFDIEINLILISCDLHINDIDDIEVKNNDEICPTITSSFYIKSYIWCGPDNFIKNTKKLLVDDNVKSGTYTLKVIDIYDCFVEKSFVLTKIEECEEIVA